MKFTTLLLSFLVIEFLLPGCKDSENKGNSLYGLTFSKVSEIPQLKDFSEYGASVLDADQTEIGNYKFAIAGYRDKNGFLICMFEELVESKETGQLNYKILDTINIGKIKESEFLTYCNCRLDTLWDSEIIALVEADHDKEYYDKIIRAWRADTKTGKISRLKNLSNITCINDGYGADGCGEDGDYETEQTQLDQGRDSLHQSATIDTNSVPDSNETD